MHQLLHLPRDRDPKPSAERPRNNIRAIFGAAVVASILTLAVGCNKRDAEAAGDANRTSLAGKPRTLMFIFGDRSDPRVLPLATLANGEIKQITLDSSGWRNFDHIYFPAGATLTAYVAGKSIGNAVIRRGMWEGESPLYKLPNCRSLRPLAAATVASAPANVMLELLATSDPLAGPPPRPAQVPADIDTARALATRVAQHEGLTSVARSELDEVLSSFYTGVSTHPTVIGSYLERGSGLNGKPRHVFVIGDYVDEAKAYVQTFAHVPQADAREYRRLIDHLDLTGDGVDEIVLEGWHIGGDSYLIFLQYKGGHWREVARSATSWCGDPAKR
ncbi:MAG: hypothetical protein JWL61_4301 [Gemmatimonadetes bacterium]|jgi:hypothetical protein|nr:hypothetical protein [Gemmatimonadota bacterium]